MCEEILDKEAPINRILKLDCSPVIALQRQVNGSQGIEYSIPCFFMGG